MFRKSRHGYKPQSQGAILRRLAGLVDSGQVHTPGPKPWRRPPRNAAKAMPNKKAAPRSARSW